MNGFELVCEYVYPKPVWACERMRASVHMWVSECEWIDILVIMRCNYFLTLTLGQYISVHIELGIGIYI